MTNDELLAIAAVVSAATDASGATGGGDGGVASRWGLKMPGRK